MTYGTLPSFEEFERDIRRPDPDESDGSPYWPKGTLYPMELVNDDEARLAEAFGALERFKSDRQRSGINSRARGYKGDEPTIYDFLVYLSGENDDGNEVAGDLASSIMTTLGYEWI